MNARIFRTLACLALWVVCFGTAQNARRIWNLAESLKASASRVASESPGSDSQELIDTFSHDGQAFRWQAIMFVVLALAILFYAVKLTKQYLNYYYRGIKGDWA